MDYVFLLNGLMLILFAFGSLGHPGLAWRWIAAFAFVHGLTEWLCMLAVGLGDTPTFMNCRIMLYGISFLFLFMYAYVQSHEKKGLNYSLCFLTIAFCAGAVATNKVQAIPALGGAGAICAGFLVWKAGRPHAGRPRLGYRLAGLGLIGYAILVFHLLPQSIESPLLLDIYDAYFKHGQFLRTFFLVLMALGIWLGYPAAAGSKVLGTSPSYRVVVRILAFGVLVGGFFEVQYVGRIADQQERDHLLVQAKSIAATVDPQRVRSLTFTEEDQHNPEYLRLRSQMIAYANAMRLRSLYSIGLRDGRLIFGPESLAEDDPLSSSPGTVFLRPAVEDYAIFHDGHSVAMGPQTDEYGTFFSVLAPVLDPRTGHVLMVIGLDVEAQTWNRLIARARLTPLLFTLLLSLILIMVVIALRYRKSLPREKRPRLRYIETVACAVVGLVLTGATSMVVENIEMRGIKQAFYPIARAQAGALQDVFRELGVSLHALSRFLENKPDQGAFASFSDSLVDSSISTAWQWVPVVDRSKRTQFEREHSSTQNDFVCWHYNTNGEREPAENREKYYPILYSSPTETGQAIAGYDLGSEPDWAEALEEASRTGLRTATAARRPPPRGPTRKPHLPTRL